MLDRLKSDRGSVLLEFCLMLPIWLLLFGGTFLIFDVSMGRLHLQESNRNLAWIQNDRFDRNGKINQELYRRATRFYDVRNSLEKSMSGEPIWSFGNNSMDKDAKDNPQQWGSTDKELKGDGLQLTAGGSWAESIPGLSSIIGSIMGGEDWAMLCSGNMELKMDKVSATYIGAIGVSSVLFPDDDESGKETVPLYKSMFTFTRAVSTTKDKDGALQQNAKFPNGEMLVLRRKSSEDTRAKIKDVNDLCSDGTIYRSWPSNGSLGDIRLFLWI